ncbi:hypothetical protein V8G54_033507, partial [Vigna mungo]
FATGVCFASAGTGYDNATSNVAGVIPLWKEVEYYKEYQNKLRAHLGEENANEILSEALYLVSIGTNDFLENYYALTERRCEFPSVEQYEDFLIGLAENFFREIYGLGARKISLTGLPPMGCLPLERAMNILEFHNCVEEYNNLALEFNGKLGWLVSKLNNDLPGLQMIDANVYDIFLKIVENPSGFGFEEATTGCCGTGRFEMGFLCDPKFTCQDANKCFDKNDPVKICMLSKASKLLLKIAGNDSSDNTHLMFKFCITLVINFFIFMKEDVVAALQTFGPVEGSFRTKASFNFSSLLWRICVLLCP